MIVDIIWPQRDELIVHGVGIVGIVVGDGPDVARRTASGPVGVLPPDGQKVFGGVYVRDGLTAFLDLLFMSIALLTMLFAPDYLRPRGLPMAEFTRDAPVRHQRRDAHRRPRATC